MFDKRRKQHRPGFTLLELVVVLAILAVVTTLAIRSLDGLEDQSRYEKNAREFEALSEAVLGSPDDRAADGSRTVSGFVADMGRLPRAVADGNGNLTLAELWASPGDGFKYDVRPATGINIENPAHQDTQVYVAGGWRGPYLRLPIDATTWRDGWGNPMTSPVSDPVGNLARLFPLADQSIRGVRHFGANGRLDPLDTGYDRDGVLVFDDNLLTTTLTVQVEVMNGDTPATAGLLGTSDNVEIRVFGPKQPTSTSPSTIKAISSSKNFVQVPAAPPLPANNGNPLSFVVSDLTAGPRVIRAYFTDSGTVTTPYTKSTVKQITLRPGANFVNLTIDR